MEIAMDEERRRRIIELFEDGRNYSEVRNELGGHSRDFLPFEEFLRIIGATSELDYRRIHASIERKLAYRNKGVPGIHWSLSRDDRDSWPAVRKRVLESNLGSCLFCHRNAEEVHHILGHREQAPSPFLVPVCAEHHCTLRGKVLTSDGLEVRKTADRIAVVFPRLYITVRKSIRTSDGDIMTYAILGVRDREQSVMRDDPCPGWKAGERVDQEGSRCVILSFGLTVSETGFDRSIWMPVKGEALTSGAG